MTDAITILGMAGSLRQDSFNTAWLPVLRVLGMQPWFGMQLYVSGAHKVFDASGMLLDEQLRERLRIYMTGFAAFVQRRS
jgi:chromate reductase, NAD(P)H dehydrogenase (quinone)